MLADTTLSHHERMVLEFIWDARPQGSLAPLTQAVAEGLESKTLIMRSGIGWVVTKQGAAVLTGLSF